MKEYSKNLGLIQLIKSPTRFSQYGNTLIDLIFSNSDDINQFKVLNWNVSDHECVGVRRKKVPVAKISLSFEGRSYKKLDKIYFQRNLQTNDRTKFYSEHDPNKPWLLLQSEIANLINVDCPVKAINIRKAKE